MLHGTQAHPITMWKSNVIYFKAADNFNWVVRRAVFFFLIIIVNSVWHVKKNAMKYTS